MGLAEGLPPLGGLSLVVFFPAQAEEPSVLLYLAGPTCVCGLLQGLRGLRPGELFVVGVKQPSLLPPSRGSATQIPQLPPSVASLKVTWTSVPHLPPSILPTPPTPAALGTLQLPTLSLSLTWRPE